MTLGDTAAYVFDGHQWLPEGAGTGSADIDHNSGPGVGTFGGDSVSRTSTSDCAAIDTTGHTLVWNGSQWGSAILTFAGALGGAEVSCATVSFCLAVASPGKADTELASTFDGSSWTTPVPTGLPRRLEGLSCISTQLCLATDSKGNLVVDRAGNWTIPNLPFQGTVDQVSCARPTFCMAVGGHNDAWTYDRHSWSAPHRFNSGPDQIHDVSCVQAGYCVVAGTRFASNTPIALAVDNEGHWISGATSFKVPADLAGLSCPTTSFCMAVDPVSGPNPDDVWWTATPWQATTPPPAPKPTPTPTPASAKLPDPCNFPKFKNVQTDLLGETTWQPPPAYWTNRNTPTATANCMWIVVGALPGFIYVGYLPPSDAAFSGFYKPANLFLGGYATSKIQGFPGATLYTATAPWVVRWEQPGNSDWDAMVEFKRVIDGTTIYGSVFSSFDFPDTCTTRAATINVEMAATDLYNSFGGTPPTLSLPTTPPCRF